MATFKQQVEGITSLSIGTTPTNDELSQFLVDGTKEVVNRIISIRPDEIAKFTTSIEDTNDSGIAVTGQILSVVREHDSTTILRPCNIIDPRDRYEASDSSSLKYRSKYNPGFYVLDGKLHTVPVAAGGNNSAFVTQVYYAVNQGHSSSSIDSFPDEYEYLVVLYASFRSVHAALSAKQMPAEPVFQDLPEDLTNAAITFGALTEKAATTINTGSMTQGSTGSAPAYTAPTTALTSFAITAAPPEPPTVPGFSVDFNSIPTFTEPPSYTSPEVSGIASDLTETLTTGDSKTDFGDWWDTWGDMIEASEDAELASAHGGKVSAFISAYSAAVQNKLNIYNTGLQTNLNKFNSELAAYQAEVQTFLSEQQFQDQAKHAAEIQQFQAEIAEYQANVGSEVQEYTQKLARYTAEQNDANQTFQSNNALFQADLQKLLTEYQSDVQIAIRNADHQAQQESEKKVRDMEALIQDYTLNLQNFQAKIAKYQADAGTALQVYQAEVGVATAEYQWLQEQYGRLKNEYTEAFNSLQIQTPAEAKA